MQGLGPPPSPSLALRELRRRSCPRRGSGEWLAAFALSEKRRGFRRGGDDLLARQDGDDYVIDGEKPCISNGGIADFYTLFARQARRRGPVVFGVRRLPDDPGLSTAERIDVIPRIRWRRCASRLPGSERSTAGAPGGELQDRDADARSLSRHRCGCSAGFARRGLDEAMDHARTRRTFGGTLADRQLTQAALGHGDRIDAAALLTYRAAGVGTSEGLPATREAATAEMAATEPGQRVIDRAVQLFGGRGVMRGEIVESLYREIRALRIYEGATEVQSLIIARELVKSR